MPVRVIRDLTDPLTKPVADYLEAAYNIPREHIVRIELHTELQDVQLIHLVLLVDPNVQVPTAREALDEATRVVPLIRPPMRDEQPRSHAPTTCAYEDGGDPMRQCGELIRWEVDEITQDINGRRERGHWAHANDAILGESNHPATPGE
jgi:hypothetical protein